MKKIILPVLVLFLISGRLSAQNFTLKAPPGYNYIYPEGSTIKGTEGSPFLGDWQAADVLFTNGGEIKDLMVRYNVLNDQLLYKEKNQVYLLVAPDSILELRFPDRTFVYTEWADGKKNFFEEVLRGKVSLLTKYEIEVTPANYNEALMSGNKNEVLNLKQKLFLKQGKSIVPINKKKVLVELLSDKSTEITAYLAKEKLSFKKKDDMKALVEYYNQL